MRKRGLCGKRRLRSGCAFAQSDKGLHCHERINGHFRMYQSRGNDTLRMREINLNLCILRMHEETFPLGLAHMVTTSPGLLSRTSMALTSLGPWKVFEIWVVRATEG